MVKFARLGGGERSMPPFPLKPGDDVSDLAVNELMLLNGHAVELLPAACAADQRARQLREPVHAASGLRHVVQLTGAFCL